MKSFPLLTKLLSLALIASSFRGLNAQTPVASPAPSPLPYTGVNLSGGEFYHPKPGVAPQYGKNFIYPSPEEFAYFASKGMNVFRVQFLWETLQPEMNKPLVPAEVDHLHACVKSATDKGLIVLLDPHNYARYYDKIVGSADVPDAAFADFWGRLAAEFKDNPNVWFGLMNEPHDLPAEQWLGAANAAIDTIRKTGAQNLILVPGIGWTSAGQWTKNGNSTVMLGLKDPANHFVYEVHMYFDPDNSGTHTQIASPTIGVERLRDFTAWCREHKARAFLGEFGAAASPEAATAIENTLSDMEKNRDVWTGFTWWSAGPWWKDYMFTLEPKKENGAVIDRPQ
ncbi:MAG TPA: glycoside hydrolase family 5 protein, partial [Chthoniobacteraceae bacterium]|nr:glycoside hydrolase family 5 protein [Chthoniobacteraceae bacterium]